MTDNFDISNPDTNNESSAPAQAEGSKLKFNFIDITPSIMSRITNYSESVCRKVLYNSYENKSTSDFIIQQVNIFLTQLRSALTSDELYDALDRALERKKPKNAEQIRTIVNLQKLNQILRQ